VSYAVQLRPEAQIEFNQSIDWYETRQNGLSWKFIEAIDFAIESISRAPEQPARVYRNVRCKSVKRFPYQIYYHITGEEVVEVLSVFHVRQRPQIWQSRI